MIHLRHPDLLMYDHERKEYLQYASFEDVIFSYKEGLRRLKENTSLQVFAHKKVVCGAMVAFDTKLCTLLNAWDKQGGNLFLLSEVTAENRRKTDELIQFPHTSTPHLLAKEIYIQKMKVPVRSDTLKAVFSKPYIAEAAKAFYRRHRDVEPSYSILWGYYAYRYIVDLFELITPSCVCLWNEFYDLHMLIRGVCEEKQIPVFFLEYGCLPGSICVDYSGQLGESYPALMPSSFDSLRVTQRDLILTKLMLGSIRTFRIDRYKQPSRKAEQNSNNNTDQQPTILFLGQNDYETGMALTDEYLRTRHSPMFCSSLETLAYLKELSKANHWKLLFRPHPIMTACSQETLEEDKNGLSGENLYTLINRATVVVTIQSQAAYTALNQHIPVVLLGYSTLSNKGCTYEAYSQNNIEKQIKAAIQKGLTESQKRAFIKHVTQLRKNYLFSTISIEYLSSR